MQNSKGLIKMLRCQAILIVAALFFSLFQPTDLYAAENYYYYQSKIRTAQAAKELAGSTLEKTYIAIIDTGVTREYARFQRKEKTGTMDYRYHAPGLKKYASESLHGTKMQLVVDELVRKAGVQENIRSISVKFKEEDTAALFMKDFCNILKKLISYKKTGKYNIRVLSISQVFNIGSGGDKKILASTLEKVHKAGISIVVAAGNNARIKGKKRSIAQQTDLATMKHVIVAGATNKKNGRWLERQDWDKSQLGSAMGRQLDLVAPGYNVGFGMQCGFFEDEWWDSGTSMAVPQVAVGAALAYALEPGYTPYQVEKLLKMSAKDLGKQKNGRNNTFGSGLLDLRQIVMNAKPSDVRLSAAKSGDIKLGEAKLGEATLGDVE